MAVWLGMRLLGGDETPSSKLYELLSTPSPVEDHITYVELLKYDNPVVVNGKEQYVLSRPNIVMCAGVINLEFTLVIGKKNHTSESGVYLAWIKGDGQCAVLCGTAGVGVGRARIAAGDTAAVLHEGLEVLDCAVTSAARPKAHNEATRA
ncbi:hypothetical protein B0H17DRAFT_1144769 [Mycena rosella]|uniref:Uncharacterized protein n=1 Tax=Mycena rosella TaxID=1033263 RepID=A0AAD7CTF3_MYCRO|nr:hypothetical protein B0H17DRAFT_1144769 [Mycena rosella]